MPESCSGEGVERVGDELVDGRVLAVASDLVVEAFVMRDRLGALPRTRNETEHGLGEELEVSPAVGHRDVVGSFPPPPGT